MDISKNLKESKNLQRKAKGLVEKWSRVVWDINTNYSSIDLENRNYEMIYQIGKRSRQWEESEEENKENLEIKTAGRKDSLNKREVDVYSHAKVPKKGLWDFTIKPTVNLVSSKDEYSRIKYNFFEKKKNTGVGKKD